ncbi:MAG TPA: hypothetical protein VJN92_24060 [Candidatus Acidoferrum sp.]|nr:hypothetical protein [Candidatus Acidoferrum sp.]
MRLSLRASVLILTGASVAAAQTKAQETPPKTQQAPKTQETTPTPPATQTRVTESKVPAAGHPVASPKEVKNLYIEPMVNDLDQYLKAEFSKQLARRIVIVSRPEDADAVMTGIGEWHNGTAQAATGRGAVQVLSKGSLLWASEAWGLLKSGSQRKVADRIVRNFKNVLETESEKEMSETYY